MQFLRDDILRLENGLERTLFEIHFRENSNIIIIMYVFDEICPMYIHGVIQTAFMVYSKQGV